MPEGTGGDGGGEVNVSDGVGNRTNGSGLIVRLEGLDLAS